MKQLLITIAALVLVGCGKSQQSAPAPETKQAPITAKAPEISIPDAAKGGNIALVKQLISTGADVNVKDAGGQTALHWTCLLYTSPSPRDATLSRMPSSA